MSIAFISSPVTHRRGLLLLTGLVAALGGAVVHLAALPALWRMAWTYGLVLTILGAAQLGALAFVLVRPTRQHLQYASAVSASAVALWLLVRWHVLAGPDPWAPASSALGITAHLDLALQIAALAAFLGLALYGPRPRAALPRRIACVAATVPFTSVVFVMAGLGIAGATNGFAGAGFPAGTVAPSHLPAAAHSVVEYCRPDGVRLAMDIYTPAAAASAPAPVALYLHAGGLVLGDRKLTGLGAALSNHEGALFTPLQRELNDRGFLVAAIDYRLLPDAAWPAPLNDAKCAVRFLRAHAIDLGIDPDRIAVWGASAGGHLGTLLGLTGSDAGSEVQAVVDMFGPTDFNDFADASPFGRFIVQIGLGSDPATRRSASPVNYIRPGAPPIMILHGTLDTDIPIRQSRTLAERLKQAGVDVTFVEVQGVGHTLATPGGQPSAQQLTTMVADFLTTALQVDAQLSSPSVPRY